MSTLLLEIVTPEAKTFSGDVEMVTIPGSEGELGVLPQHAPLLTQIKPGELHIREKGGKETWLAVGDGFVEVLPTRVSILTDSAVEAADIDEQAVQAAIEKAEADKRERSLTGEEHAMTEALIARSLAQLRVKRRHKHL